MVYFPFQKLLTELLSLRDLELTERSVQPSLQQVDEDADDEADARPVSRRRQSSLALSKPQTAASMRKSKEKWALVATDLPVVGECPCFASVS